MSLWKLPGYSLLQMECQCKVLARILGPTKPNTTMVYADLTQSKVGNIISAAIST
jgi:hypothetical protein